MPLANSYVNPEEINKPEFVCPLSLVRCTKCSLIQLTHVVPPDLMFAHYLYVSSTTPTFRKHFSDYADSILDKIIGIQDPFAVDIGSNDGLLLSYYQQKGMRITGIDPATNLANQANKQGLTTLNRYFDKECVKTILETSGPAHAISANNVFAHIDDIYSVCSNAKSLLHDKGIFVIEFPYLVKMLNELLFDMIYHEHLSYISVKPLEYLLDQFKLEIFHIDEVQSHGGSLRVFIQKQTTGGRTISPVVKEMSALESTAGLQTETPYEVFAEKVLKIKNSFITLVSNYRKKGLRVAGYGAPAKASTILNFYGLNASHIDYIVDDNELKQNHLSPGAKIPIVSSSHLDDFPADVIIIFAWNFATEILAKIGHLSQRGVEFIIPIPNPQLTPPIDSTIDVSFHVRPSTNKP